MKLRPIHFSALRRKQRGFIGAGKGGFVGGYEVQRSVRLRSAASASLSRTPGAAGNRRLLAGRYRIKRGTLGSLQVIASAGTASIDRIYFDASDRLCLDVLGTTRLVSTQVFRDPGSWYVDIEFQLDVANATAASRAKLLIDGVEISSYSTDTRSSITNTDTNWNNTVVHYLGRDNAGNYFDGYLAEPIGVDGSTSSTYSSTDSTTNQRLPVRPSATYGTNGFYLDFSDITSTTTLGYDKSGNSNNWTANNISLTAGVTYDSMLDVPGVAWADGGNGRGNYAVLNPLIASAANISYANLRSGTTPVQATQDALAFNSQWEVTAGASNVTAGVISGTGTTNTTTVTANKTFSFRLSTSGSLDYRNVTDAGSWTAITTGLSGQQFPYGTTAAADWNFGQRPFSDTLTATYKALQLGNTTQPTGAAAKPWEHYYVATVTKSGNTNFTIPWNATDYDTLFEIKRRDATGSWYQVDGLRGYDKYLSSNSTAAETTDANVIGVSGTTITLKSTLADGTYVIYCRKAGLASARQTNTSGTITSTVSANVEAGFSIVLRDGTGANGTFGHGLGKVPAFRVVKARQAANAINRSWACWHSVFSGTEVIFLDQTSAKATGVTAYWNSTTPSSSLCYLGTENTVNNNTGGVTPYVEYIYAEIPGYSKFGSYPGNGSADGPFVYGGLLPRSALTKRTDAAGEGWMTLDSARDTHNVESNYLRFDQSNAEAVNATLDATAAGAKIRAAGGSSPNVNTGTYIYALTAEFPFQFANAR